MMFEFLKQISIKVYERYLTLEKNIKSASNSFYDAYLDMQEELLKHIIADFEIEIITRKSFGELLRLDEIKNVFIVDLKVDEYSYDKMLDYSLKINSHKHKGEKKIEIETIVKYLTIFYEVSSQYAKYKCVSYDSFDIDYIETIFNSFEKENQELKDKLENYRDLVEESNLNYVEKEKYRMLLSYSEITSATLEEQNSELKKRIVELSKLKDHIDFRFNAIDERLNRIEYGEKKQKTTPQISLAEEIMIKSKKEYVFCENESTLQIWKTSLSVFFFIVLTVGILTSHYATKFFKLYSTFTLFENIFLFLTIFMFVYVLKAKMFYDVNKYKSNTIERIHFDKYGVPRDKSIKAKYLIFLIISVISSLAHLFLSVGYYDEYNVEYRTTVIVLEIIYIVFIVTYLIMVRCFFNNYFLILHTVKKSNGEIEKYMDDGVSGQLRPFVLKNQ